MATCGAREDRAAIAKLRALAAVEYAVMRCCVAEPTATRASGAGNEAAGLGRIFLSHGSAIEFWRSSTAARLGRAGFSPAVPERSDTPRVKRIETLLSSGFANLSDPVTVFVSDAATRRSVQGATCRYSKVPLPENSFLQISPGLCVASPEFCFVQAAGFLSIAELAKLGFELCGSYALDPHEEGGIRRRDALSCARALARFAAEVRGVAGAKKARRAALYVLDGSASPMETAVALLLTLPHSLGGYALPAPKMNQRVDIPVHLRSTIRESYFKCDLYWSDARLAVEYDSSLFHSGDERRESDSSRHVSLALLGVETVHVTRFQVLNVAEMEKVATVVAKRLGVRLRPPASFSEKRRALRNALFGFSSSG